MLFSYSFPKSQITLSKNLNYVQFLSLKSSPPRSLPTSKTSENESKIWKLDLDIIIILQLKINRLKIPQNNIKF